MCITSHSQAILIQAARGWSWASSRGPRRVQAALGQCDWASRTPPQWLPTHRWPIALTALVTSFSCNAGLALRSQSQHLKWRQAAGAASSLALSRSVVVGTLIFCCRCMRSECRGCDEQSFNRAVFDAIGRYHAGARWLGSCVLHSAWRRWRRRVAGADLCREDMPFGTCWLARKEAMPPHTWLAALARTLYL